MARILTALAILLFAACASCNAVFRRTTSYGNSSLATSTLTTFSSMSTPVCCWLAIHSVNVQVWYVSSVDVTASTILTQTYQYNDTKIVNSTTIAADYATPTGYFDPATVTTTLYGLDGVPTDIVQSDIIYSNHFTTLVQGTAVTDPYGNVIQSPTPFFVFGSQDPITYQTAEPTMTSPTDNELVCVHGPDPYGEDTLDAMVPYPSGFWLPLALDNASGYYDQESYQGNFRVEVPRPLFDYMQANVRPGASSHWSSVSLCSAGVMDGQPTAHIAVNQLTGSASTTILVNGNYNAPTQTKPAEVTTVPTALPQTSQAASTPLPVTSPQVPTEIPPTTAPELPEQTPTPTSGNDAPGSGDEGENGGTVTQSTAVVLPPVNTPVPNPVTPVPGDTDVGGSPTDIPPVTNTVPAFTAPGTTIIGDSGTTFVIGSSTLTPGGTVIDNSNTYVLPSTPTAVIVNGNTQAIQPTAVGGASQQTPAPIFVVGGTTYSGNSATEFVIGTATLTPGGTVVAGSTTYVLPLTGTAVVVNGVSHVIESSEVNAASQQTSAPIFTAAGVTFSGNSATEFIIGTATLTPGGTVVADRTTYILSATPTAVTINGKTQNIDDSGITSVFETQIATLVVGSSTYTANTGSAFVIGGQTLTPGGVITNSAGVFSLGAGGTELVIISGTSTTTNSIASITTTIGGGSAASTSSSSTSPSSSGRAPLVTNSGIATIADTWLMGGLMFSVLGAIFIL